MSNSNQKAVNRGANGQFTKGNGIGKDTRFKKGDVPNPNGRRGALADIINTVFLEEDVDGKTNKERMIRKVYKMALNGSLGLLIIYHIEPRVRLRNMLKQKLLRMN